jgi:AcrR family transcriptional regulator
MPVKVRREALVEAAIRVMVRDGVARATTRAIVAEAGMTLGVFHYCFDSREELLRKVTRRLTDHNVSLAREAFASERDLRRAIARSLQAFWGRIEAAPKEELLGFELTQYALRQEDLKDLARYQYANYLAALEEFLTSAADAARVEWTVPVATLARYVNATIEGLSLCWLADRDTIRTEEALELLTDYLVSRTREKR